KLVAAFDAVEKKRGFNPPLFVDVRLKREVRAPGFHGDNFQKTLTKAETRRGLAKNYMHMSGLGNVGILDKSRIKIKNPKDAEKLLDEAIQAADQNRRVVFFCACEIPKSYHRRCHRRDVAGLVLKAAKRRKVPVEIVEWPGGDPSEVTLDVS